MIVRGSRLLVYAALALVGYLTAFVAGAGSGFATFLGLGALAEVAFWVELVRGLRRSE